MFKFLADSIENAMDVATDVGDMLTGGELPDKSSLAQLIADGLTVAAAAELFGVAESVIEDLIASEKE